MASGRESWSKRHKYKGMSNSQVARPESTVDEDDPEERTLSEMRNKYRHLRSVADGTSQPVVKPHSPDEVFGNVYPEFLNFYSRGQLQHLEKLFLMADQDRDGHLNMFEVKYWMEKHGNPISQREAKEIFKIADENKDGRLSFREFIIFCQKIELKNIPSDNQNINIHRMIEDPTGQSKSYPPRSPDDGVGKMATRLKSFAQIKGNIGSARKYFENEIAKETESSQRDRQTYDAIMENKRTYSRCKKTTPSASMEQSETRIQNQGYRNSLKIQLAPVDEEHNQNNYTSFYPRGGSNHSNSSRLYQTSAPFVVEDAQVQRTSINMKLSNPQNEQFSGPTNENFNGPVRDDCEENPASEWHPNLYRNTYKTSLLFLNNQQKLENRPPTGKEKGKYSFRHDKEKHSYKNRSTPHRNPQQQQKCDPSQREENNRRKDQSDLEGQRSPLLGLTPSDQDITFPKRDSTHPTPVSDDQIHILKSGFSNPMAEQQVPTPHPPPPPPLPVAKENRHESVSSSADQDVVYTKSPLVELFLLNQPKSPTPSKQDKVQEYPERKSISVQTTFPTNDTILEYPQANTTAVQTSAIEIMDQSSDTADIPINVATPEIDSGFNSPINSEFALL